ncbi:MAG TPA: NAD-dependent epimerase/dehydratase family protein [Candidatus Woesearchaeota archaeon]|jgi:UDP-glucose 4-epimerase|nr:NAD-dependent epimerase/dehydratase family protein [Candidatus Woesearchaeota archaeon]|tara:strand:- start:2288 stop:3190 length:903 start_codon:yes stop_codon:yes gene_type:complete
MKVLITGGSGFIGSYLVKHLLEQGHEVKVLDLRKPDIEHKKLEFVNKSVMDELAEDIHGCDIVYHFAAMLGVDNSDKRPLETMRINLEGSVNVFKSAVEANVKRMIYASSSEVYGEPRELPIGEDSVKGPVSAYGVSKLAAEIYAKAYNHEFGTDIKIVRFFNVYGRGQSNNFVIPIFINKALENKPLKVFGEGSQTRCFTYVEDIAEGVFTVLEKGKTGEAYNIGNNQPTTILELAQTIKAVTGSKSEIIKAGFGRATRLKSREIEYRIPDISKMKALGWEPKTMVREGIKKILEFRKN